jgi:hypothetical protein
MAQFEKLVYLDELKRFGGAPKESIFTPNCEAHLFSLGHLA